jgi:2-hydroxychromene-2-carboxylate isomerase
MTSAIRFLFDYVSPYAYLASTQLPALASRRARDVELVPVLFAGLLDATGARGPAEIPAKRQYMVHDVTRLGRALGVPIEPPPTHPFNPLVALRVTAAVEDSVSRLRLADALYRAAWVLGLRIDTPEVVAHVATEAGLDGVALLDRATSPEGKARLRLATEEALAAGAFGVPTMLVDGELFWGVDSLPLLERFLGGERAMDADKLARWRLVTPSAQRRSST